LETEARIVPSNREERKLYETNSTFLVKEGNPESERKERANLKKELTMMRYL